MDKVIPILPCADIKAQVEFYRQLGFELLGLYTSPNPYAVLQFGTIELHFYGSKKMLPAHNSAMCFVKVDDVDAVYATFSSGLKENTGKIPRSGIPRLSKVRDLSSDRRFTLTDLGGNTFYIGTPVTADTGVFFRTLQSEEWAKKFAVLYDVLHSKEDAPLAANMLPKFAEARNTLEELDTAKLLLLELEVRREMEQARVSEELEALLEAHRGGGDSWEKVERKYREVLRDE